MVNPNDKSKIINLCDYPVSWERKTLSGDEWIKANGTCYIVNSELETQKDNGNYFIVGTDGIGSHADIYIDNEELREEYGFDCKKENKKQLILDEDECARIIESKTMKAFKKNLESSVITNSEKIKIMNYVRNNKLNDYEKIQALEEYCHSKFKAE